MNHRLIQGIRRHAAMIDASQPQSKFGVVTSYDPNTHNVKVMVMPDNVESGWLPVSSPMVTGNGSGMQAPPAVGQQVFLVPQEGDANSYVVMGSCYSSANRPPKPTTHIGGDPEPVQSGEFCVVTPNGGVLRMCNDGSMYLESQGIGYSLILTNSNGAWKISNSDGTITLLLGAGTFAPSITATVVNTKLVIVDGQITCTNGTGTLKPVMVQGGGVSNVLFASS